MKDIETVQGRLQFVLIPAWMDEALLDPNKGFSRTLLDVEKLNTILSTSDVEKYIRLNKIAHHLLVDVAKVDDSLAVMGYNNQTDEPMIGPPISDSNMFDGLITDGMFEENKHESILFDYFGDSAKVKPGSRRYYVEIIPLHDNVMGVHLRIAGVDDDARLLQKEAIRQWIIAIDRFVSFEAIAKSGFLSDYLRYVGNKK